MAYKKTKGICFRAFLDENSNGLEGGTMKSSNGFSSLLNFVLNIKEA